MRALARISLALLIFTAGMAVGLGIALYLEMQVLMIDQIIPGVGTVWA